MLSMLRSLVLLGAACAAAVAPAPEAKANSTARLEALVRDMAQGQRDATAEAPAPRPKLVEEDVVILENEEVEEEQRRRLGRCDCDSYRNGAYAGAPVCAKVESGVRVCYPTMNNGQCGDSRATRCSGGPAPSPFATAEEAQHDVFVNVNLQLYHAGAAATSQLPTANDFAVALANIVQVAPDKVEVLATWGSPTGVRGATPVAQQQQQGGTTATVHATVAVRDAQRRETVEALLTLANELPAMHGRVFTIASRQVFEQSSRALVCAPPAETIKSESASLLRQLVALKQQEVDLMRQAVAQSAGTSACNSSLLQRIAAALGLSLA